MLDAIKPSLMADVALNALQNKTIKQISDTFENNNISFVFLKAAGVRDELYESLGLRPCTDIDLLVSPVDRHRAASALTALGAKRVSSPDDPGEAAHESTWQQGLVDIDLHWDILGPGRLPPALTTQVLARRKKTAMGWRPDDIDCVLIALVHPAFAKHVCFAAHGIESRQRHDRHARAISHRAGRAGSEAAWRRRLVSGANESLLVEFSCAFGNKKQ